MTGTRPEITPLSPPLRPHAVAPFPQLQPAPWTRPGVSVEVDAHLRRWRVQEASVAMAAGAPPTALTRRSASEIRFGHCSPGPAATLGLSCVSVTCGAGGLRSSLGERAPVRKIDRAKSRSSGVCGRAVRAGQDSRVRSGQTVAGIEVGTRLEVEKELPGVAPWPCAFWESPLWSQSHVSLQRISLSLCLGRTGRASRSV